MRVEVNSSVQAKPGDVLMAGEVQGWMAFLPPDAHLTPILREYGTQRDPVTCLHGLAAKWHEDR